MVQLSLPVAFIEAQKSILSPSEWSLFEEAVSHSEPVTSIRLNPAKISDPSALPVLMDDAEARPVPWCPEGRYLSRRPSFTLDPLLHAGAYYVQEPSSMFVTHVVRSLVSAPVTALDLCASPGGKTTALQSALPPGSLTVSNEIDRRRARILAENVTKWGCPDVIVTANAPADFSSLISAFDLILVDAPCSGEGMFRKDPATIAEWSPAKVRECADTQRRILRDIWPALRPGGLLIYSTCTYNIHENEEILSYLCSEMGAEALEVPVSPDWHIRPPLVGTLPCYRFMPHLTAGEGLFLSVVRKSSEASPREAVRSPRAKRTMHHAPGHARRIPLVGREPLTVKPFFLLPSGYEFVSVGETQFAAFPSAWLPLLERISAARLYTLLTGVELASLKGRDLLPSHALALSSLPVVCKNYASCEVDTPLALQYLRREAVVLPDAPRGYVRITHRGLGLGWVKNLGSRANNLYPPEWRIRFQ